MASWPSPRCTGPWTSPRRYSRSARSSKWRRKHIRVYRSSPSWTSMTRTLRRLAPAGLVLTGPTAARAQPPDAGREALRISREPCGYCEVMPPSAVITEPVRKEESSLARNRATAAISSGVPSRPIGYLATVSASPAAMSPPPRAVSIGSISGVYTVPGQMALTRTPRGARSTDMDRVRATTAPLDAQYEAKFAMPTTAATEPWLMIDPLPAATIERAATWEHTKVPLALTAKHRSQSSSVASITEPLLLTPALLYSTSTRPNSLVTWANAPSTWAGSARAAPPASALPPASAISPAVSLTAWVAMSTSATDAPSRANSTAAARPIPDPAPVTTATLPASL